MTDCLFCKIASGEIPSKKVYEDSGSFAFLDINPRNPGHTLVIPKKHSQDIFSIGEGEAVGLMKALRRVAIGVQKATGVKGISISQSNGQLAGQVIPHIHFHVIPRTEAEKGLGLESVFPVKKQEEASLDSMAKRISGSIPKERATEPPKEEPPGEAEPAKEAPPEGEEAERPKKPEEQDINFDEF